ncbi:MAG: hypothetical protein IT453_04870 [Planctomycetes bacterium]|nr:hypothetical protein [Planctomycetota bacterium]
MKHSKTIALAALALTAGVELAQAQQAYSWRYFRPNNTGIQGDNNEALYIGADGDPWIGGYNPIWEEGGVAKFVQADDRWIDISNVDWPAIGHPNDQGCVRVTDILQDGQGKLWCATWRGAFRFDPKKGGDSIQRFGPGNSTLPGGFTEDIELAPDGSVIFSAYSSIWGGGGISRYQPATNTWSSLGLYGGKIASQPKPGGGFYVWASIGGSFGGSARWDSTTNVWTSYPLTANQPRELISKQSVDDVGNVWMLRMVDTWDSTLDCMRPDGTWIHPPLPTLPVAPPYIAAVHAFGNFQALMVDGFGNLQRFDGSAWTNLGPVPIGGFIDGFDIDAAGNVWLCGIGGAAKRDVATGAWQRYRITNTGNCDSFNGDLAIDPVNGYVYATANAAAGTGGMTRFDGERWVSWNQATYGLGYDWPFMTDNCQAIAYRPSNGRFVASPADWIYGVHEWTGSAFQQLPGLDGATRMLEDATGRLWAIGGTIGLGFYTGSTWTNVPGIGGGAALKQDPTDPATIWAANDLELMRTNGTTSLRKTPADYPGSSQSFTGLAIGADGSSWIGTWQQFTSTGSTLMHLDGNGNVLQSWQHDAGWPFPGEHVRPLGVTPDGRVWMSYDAEYPSNDMGLCWFDGVNVGKFPAPPGGVPQWGGLPHAAINDFEIKPIAGGYELWMSFGSRGIASLTVLDQPLGTTYCAGDGSAAGASCPCGNSSASGTQSGCKNSTGVGATLRALGTSSVAADDFALSAAQLPPNANGLVFMGANAVNATPFGDGLRCVGAPIYRFAVKKASASGTLAYGPGQIAWIESHLAGGAWISAGATRRFQAWYRDPTGPCGAGFNTTNALEIHFTP